MSSAFPVLGLRSALAQGLALSALYGCGSAPEYIFDDPEGSGGAASGGATAASGGAPGAGGSANTGGTLAQWTPDPDQKVCRVPGLMSGYLNETVKDCCEVQYCVAADDGGQCPERKRAEGRFSGTGCLVECADPKGPFSPNADIEMNRDAPCCYVISVSMEDRCIEGRPLRVADTLLMAAVVRRNDWMMN
ncbi:MAG TPA: hypothetical protein VN764_19325 [Polyangiaceae bacterium]|nr:hypothetical protein [Polyangiaceae bacterium]